MIQPTGSKTDLLLACQWPWDHVDPEPVEVGEMRETARYGLAFHQLMSLDADVAAEQLDTIAAYYHIAGVTELAVHVAKCRALRDAWLRGENEWATDFSGRQSFAEYSVMINPETCIARSIKAPDPSTHVYKDATPTDLPMTLDWVTMPAPPQRGRRVVIKLANCVVVMDYKTGESELPPADQAGQLLSGALTMATLANVPHAVVAFLHAPRDNAPSIFAAYVNAVQLLAHRNKLREAFDRLGDGSMRPGPHCSRLYCSARPVCPTQQGQILKDGRAAVEAVGESTALVLASEGGIITAEKVGRLHQLFAAAHKMEEAARPQMKEWIRANGPAVRPDGKLVVLQSRSVERLSKASVVRALGKKEGERELERLREKGALTEKEEEYLKVEDDDGK